MEKHRCMAPTCIMRGRGILNDRHPSLPRDAALDQRGPASLGGEKEQSNVSKSSSFHLRQLHLCYSAHREGEQETLHCGPLQKHRMRVNQGSDCVSAQGHVWCIHIKVSWIQMQHRHTSNQCQCIRAKIIWLVLIT